MCVNELNDEKRYENKIEFNYKLQIAIYMLNSFNVDVLIIQLLFANILKAKSVE